MNRLFYPRLAAQNIAKNYKTYLPYILGCVTTVIMFYIMQSLSGNDGFYAMRGTEALITTMELGCNVVGLFAVVFLFYTNSFLIKRRKKEFGLYNILGMEKKHIAVIIAYETLYVAAISIVGGVLFGILFDKLAYMLLSRVVGGNVQLGFYISPKVILTTAELFLFIFAAIFVRSVLAVRLSSPIELLRGGSVGEREPKARWLMALAGAVCLGIGYYMSVTAKNAIDAINEFFIAVILVIIGTYLLFTAGSIALLKLLRKNKRYYYKENHFISVSGMMYRMKQNAVGLANICILSTMVLVMASSTTSLIVGMDDVINTRYPNDFTLYYYGDSMDQCNDAAAAVKSALDSVGVERSNEESSSNMVPLLMVRDGSRFLGEAQSISNICVLDIMTLDEFNRLSGENRSLGENEIMLFPEENYDYDFDTLEVFDRKYTVAVNEKGRDSFLRDKEYSFLTDVMQVVVPSSAELEHLKEASNAEIMMSYSFDTDLSAEEEIELSVQLRNALTSDYQIDCREAQREEVISLYGGIFFLGMFLGLLFICATVTIIYYKQVSEGYDDKKRFDIMQRVGMSRSEVKGAIRSQVLTMFFLPIIVAAVHVGFALPMIIGLLQLLSMFNTWLYVGCTAVAFAVFAAVYCVVYALTARVYYRIVSR